MYQSPRVNRNSNTAATVVPLRRSRFWIICLFFLMWGIVIGGRLFWLQIVRHKEFEERADRQQLETIQVAPRRGVLYDRNLRDLAMTVEADSFFAVPAEIADKRTAAHLLASIVHVDQADAYTSESQIAERLDNGRSFAWIARRTTPEVAAQVKELTAKGTLKGIYSHKEFERSYPDDQIAAQVLGYVGIDDNGLGGLEQKFDVMLHGVPGRINVDIDARRRALGSRMQEPLAGRNLVLTIDEKIQFIAERALDHAMEKFRPLNGTVVVQDVHTGEILALAMRPTFNPNNARKTPLALLKDHAVSDAYEPGSVFKLVTYSAALDQHVTSPDDMIDCQGGQIQLPGRVIHDDKSDHYGVITVHAALEHSSDVAAVKLAQKVGQEKFNEYIHQFGFGARTGLELPGETRGILAPFNKWGTTSYASISIGQEVGVTPLQMVSMVSTIANGGIYLPPHVLMPGQVGADAQKSSAALKPSPFRAGEDLPNPLPPGAHRVISELAAAQMRKMMEGVVLYGSGRPAMLNGYSAGGKTGTAQKIDPKTHLYSKTMHIASFAGIAPVNNPVISIAVIIDDPTQGPSYYGTAVSAPVFQEVAQQTLEYLEVPHDTDVQAPKVKGKPEPAIAEDDAPRDASDINALFAAVNDLPADDPLRVQPAQSDDSATSSAKMTKPASALPAGIVASAKGNEPDDAAHSHPFARNAVLDRDGSTAQLSRAVMVTAARKLKVPSLVGLPVRQVVEQAEAAGLAVRISGNGRVREQAPAAGTMVATGTQIVVRCGH